MSTLFGGVGLAGLPIPSPEVVARLKQVDRHIGIRWMHSMKCWMLTWEWKENDPRREMIQKQEMHPDDAFDALAFAPAELDIEDAYAYLVRGIRANTQEYAKSLIHSVHKWNEQQQEENAKPVMDEAFNEIEVMGGKLFAAQGAAVPKVYNAGIPKAPAAVKPAAVKPKAKTTK